MRTSIKKRLVGNFMLVIIMTVLILEVFLANAVKQYYYKGLEEILSNQITLSADFYSRYFSSNSLKEIIMDDIDVFWRQTKAQVQILDSEGKVLMDSIGVSHFSDPINTLDVAKALEGNKGTWIGNVEYDNSPVMAVAYPIIVEDEIIGVLRFISTLRNINIIIGNITKVFTIVGLIAVLISGVISIFLANTIIHPLREVTEVAEKMAGGNLKIRTKKRSDDEIGKLSDTLNYMAEELIRKEQLKNDFISSISHELRTPLTSIKGWAITLKSDNTRDEELLVDGLDIIEKESDRLSNMVEELLDFSRFVSGRITLEKKKINIAESIRQVGKQFQFNAESKDIEFNINCDFKLPPIYADGNRIKQVLINLLDNAFKFTPEGGKVTLNARDNGQDLLIEVIDNGCGIGEDDLPYIKEKFYKGKSSKASSGLGLSICDEIIKLHNGTMQIESRLNEGTKVMVTIPIEGVEN
ncbi:sensor histidine kinase [Tepidimicrobium xylanilyticum]|uniref:sensor histidine kinase n=1 Tax=Tepidimicrobium xylanilyticum TaxID=1123352 RepID=UPI002654737B|nr:HAMP domain-containing sensor histidine kinase [Tepidimicrobium xylanilyticum]GMG95884.1 sensor histidine kinase [Tepidimicrobium xylanilyticum]